MPVILIFKGVRSGNGSSPSISRSCFRYVDFFVVQSSRVFISDRSAWDSRLVSLIKYFANMRSPGVSNLTACVFSHMNVNNIRQ